MTKFDWSKAKPKLKPVQERLGLERAADRLLAGYDTPTGKVSPAQQVINRLGSPKPGTYQDRDGVWIVSHTTGRRVVHHFASLAAAHAGGFPWAV